MHAGSGHHCLASAATPADGVERLVTKAMEMGREEQMSGRAGRASRARRGWVYLVHRN